MSTRKFYSMWNSFSLKLTTKTDDIAYDNDDIYRAVLSCGHACDPNSLTNWCRSILDDGTCTFTCPALSSTQKPCNAQWPYHEVRLLGLLTPDECVYFENKLVHNFLQLNINSNNHLFDYRQCPKCECNLERTSSLPRPFVHQWDVLVESSLFVGNVAKSG